MQLGWQQYFHHVVLEAVHAYEQAEHHLTDTLDDAAALRALREGGAAAIYLHHYADLVLAERAPFIPDHVHRIGQLRAWLKQHCPLMALQPPFDAVGLLGDVADALKHGRITHSPERRQVGAYDAVLTAEGGYGQFGYGEGKFGGARQIIVQARSGVRPLSAVLRYVIDAWQRVMP